MNKKVALLVLLREKLSRARGAREPVAMLGPGPVKEERTSLDWPECRDLSDRALHEKLERLPAAKMEELYKKLERETDLRRDPGNYEPAVIIRNFILLWRRKLSSEELRKNPDEVIHPLSSEDVEKVWGSGRRRIAEKSRRILEDDDF